MSRRRDAALARVQVLGRGREVRIVPTVTICVALGWVVWGQAEVRVWAAGILDGKAMFFKLRPGQSEGGLLSFIFGWSPSKKKKNLKKKKKKKVAS